MHNDLNLTEALPAEPTVFHSRPFRVIHGDRFAHALSEGIDGYVLNLAARIGAVDQWVDSTDVLSYPDTCRRLRGVYEAEN